jgi:hypothetical protein
VRLRDVLELSRRELESLLRDGHAIDLTQLEDTEYRGVSLGLPGWVERVTWKKFMKTFAVDRRGNLAGWNVRIIQDGLDAPWRPMTRRGQPITFGHFDVDHQPAGTAMLRYRGAMQFLRDPLVALDAGDCSLLLGRSLVSVGPWRIGTPSYFVLEREGPLTYRAPGARGA